MQETPVRSLGRAEWLEKGQATHSCILGLPWWLTWWRICLQCRRPGFDPWVGKTPPWRRGRLPTPVFLGFPGGSHGEESACSAGDLGSIPGLGRPPPPRRRGRLPTPVFWPGEFHGLYIVHGVAKSQTRLSDFHFTSFQVGLIVLGDMSKFWSFYVTNWNWIDSLEVRSGCVKIKRVFPAVETAPDFDELQVVARCTGD